MATKKKDYDQKKYYDAQTEGMFFGGLAKDMTAEQKKKMKEAEKALKKIAQSSKAPKKAAKKK